MIDHNDCVIGTCSLCGGPVCTPHMWWGTNAPTPTCRDCGATPKQSHGKVIEMEKNKSSSFESSCNSPVIGVYDQPFNFREWDTPNSSKKRYELSETSKELKRRIRENFRDSTIKY